MQRLKKIGKTLFMIASICSLLFVALIFILSFFTVTTLPPNFMHDFGNTHGYDDDDIDEFYDEDLD